MGITAVDIAQQREMLERGEQIRREVAEAEERQRLRDQFDGGGVVHVDSSEIRVMGNEMYGIEHPQTPTRVGQHK